MSKGAHAQYAAPAKDVSSPSLTPLRLGLQRKCACEGTNNLTGECAECEDRKLQRKAAGAAGGYSVPPIVSEVLRSPGQALDAATRVFFEPRFGHDFSEVRVHADTRGAESARAVNALAYTVGRDIVFASGLFEPRTNAGQRLLAHELTHTIQQAGGLTAGLAKLSPGQHDAEGNSDRLAVSRPDDASERESDRVADAIMRPGEFDALAPGADVRVAGSMMLQRQPAAQPPPAILPRGTNPAACIAPLCDRLSQQAAPTNDTEVQQRSNDWATQTLDCVRSGASGSNASHASDIVANEETEVRAEASHLNARLTTQTQGGSALQTLQDNLRDTCRRKEREVKIEFHYNVVFENPVDGPQWGVGGADWDSVESALSGLPVEATWLNGRLLRFRREACHPQDVDPTTQACTGQALPGGVVGFTGGEADPLSGRVQVFQQGLGSRPYSRSAGLGLPATTQTIQHEVGHIIDSQVAATEEFFESIMHWHDYPWFWVTTPPAGNANASSERERLRAELGMDDAQLNTWLNGLPRNTNVVRGSRTYTRSAPSGADQYLLSFETAQMPTGSEFEYARTSRGEYFSELYALGISRPEFLHTTLPAAQLAWLKRTVFHTPENLEALAGRTSLPAPLQAELISRGSRLFTWDQLDALMDELTSRAQPAGGQPPIAGAPGQPPTPQGNAPTGQQAGTTAPRQAASLRDIYHEQVRERVLTPLRKADAIRFLNTLRSLDELERHALEVDEPFFSEARKIFHGLSLWTIRLILRFGQRRPDYTQQLYLAVSDRRFREIKHLLHTHIQLRDESFVPGVREMLNYELRDVPARLDIMSDLFVSEEGRRASDEFARATIGVVKDLLLADLKRSDGPSFMSHLNSLNEDDRALLDGDFLFLSELRKYLRGKALWIVRLRLRFFLGLPEYVQRLSMAVSELNVQSVKGLLQQFSELRDESKVPGVREMISHEFRDHPQRIELLRVLTQTPVTGGP